MHRTAKQWLACAWIAVLAVLFNALAPTVSHALQRAAGAVAQADICTAPGMAATAMPGRSAPAKSMKDMTDCGYCATHAGSFGLPPPAGFALAVPGPHAFHPFLFYCAPYPLPVWTAPQSRAPPAFV